MRGFWDLIITFPWVRSVEELETATPVAKTQGSGMPASVDRSESLKFDELIS